MDPDRASCSSYDGSVIGYRNLQNSQIYVKDTADPCPTNPDKENPECAAAI